MGFPAGPAYDLASGLGSVDAYHLALEWSFGTFSTTTLVASPVAGAPTDSITLTATVKGGGAKPPTGTVNFVVLDVSLGSAAVGADGTATLKVTGSQLGAGNALVTSYYGGDALYAASASAAAVAIQPPGGSGSLVVAEVNPNPVVMVGAFYPMTVTLTERAGVATTITSSTYDGNAFGSSFTSTTIPAYGTVAFSTIFTGTPGIVSNFLFSGKDADGRTWSAPVTVKFADEVANPPLLPNIAMTTAAPTVIQNPNSTTCPWAQPITIHETGGFLTTLAAMSAGSTSLTSQIPNIFGTARIAPFGTLQGTVCLTGVAPSAARTFSITGITVEQSVGYISSVSGALAPPPATQTAMTIPQTPVILKPDASGTATTSLPLSFDSGSPAWTASVAAAGSSSSWLTVSPLSGSGNAAISVKANVAGLSKGAYFAILTVQSQAATTQTMQVPVTLVVGASNTVTIAGISNNFTGETTFAPGEQIAVYGTNLVTAAQTVRQIPLLVTAQGMSATVNGIAAPIYFASSGQLDLQIPYEVGAGPAVLAVNNNGQVAVFPFTVAQTAPGVFPLPISNTTGAPVTTATTGDVLLLFMTGEGEVTPFLASGATPSATAISFPKPRLPVTITIGGVNVTPLFAGIPPGLAGVSQIDLVVPPGVPKGPQKIIVTVGSVAATAIPITIQ
jgi:uncharacterized protein (TIGR03437 family)